MTIPPNAAYTLARALSGYEINGEVDALSEPFGSMAHHLAVVSVNDALTGPARQAALAAARSPPWSAMLAACTYRDELVKAIASSVLVGPVPEGEAPERWATAADVRKLMAESRWAWEDWISTDEIMGVAGFEGTGKTRFALDLCRRIHAGDLWPDGQAATFPKGTRSVWVCADGHHGELVETIAAFGLPDEAVLFPSLASDPYGGTDLDTEETISALEEVIKAHRPGLVIIDTLTSATGKDLCSQAVMKALKTPLVALCQTYGVIIMLLLHVSKEGQALGRRIKGITRTLIHLECPDPENAPARLRAWVEKSFAKKPPPLGVTMTDAGNEYDFKPPTAPEPSKGGRPSVEREKAKGFLMEALTLKNDRLGNELAAEFASSGGNSKTLWRAVNEMVSEGELVKDGGTGTGQQVTLHLIIPKPETVPECPS